MKSAGWYLVHEGRRLIAATKAEARRIGQAIADKTGRQVVWKALEKPAISRRSSTSPASRASRAAPKPARRTMRRNPDTDLAYMFEAIERARAERREFMRATKAKRLAKSMRGANRGGAVKAAEAAALKTAKFAVDLRGKVNGVLQTMTLYRASRSAADHLAGDMKAAGYTANVREV